MDRCPLCGSERRRKPLRGADGRSHALCEECWLISADRERLLSREAAEAHYRTHENSIDNEGYVRFLRRVIDPLLPRLSTAMRGLDYGCGPGPTLSTLLRQHGIECADYDPLFADAVLEPPYDFVFATEVFEHFVEPAEEIQRITTLLRPGGYLGVMTELWTELERFANWYYTRDPTHVSFFHDRSVDHVCRMFGFERLASDDRRVLLLRRVG